MSNKTVSLKQAKQDVLLALRRLAFYHATMVEVLKEELGEEQGKKLACKVVDSYGRKVGDQAKKKTLGQGLELTAQNYSEDLPGLGFDAKLTNEDPFTAQVESCPLALYWRKMGCEEDGMIYCRVDQAKYTQYNPDLECVHQVHALRDKKSFCEIVVKEKKK